MDGERSMDMSNPIVFGEISGIEEGHWFQGRREMMPSSFHRKWAAGIDGNGIEGTAAIVLSGGYEDDFDLGDQIIYTGAGGNDTSTGKQFADQSWENPGNAGLIVSRDRGLPVRVIRGYKHKSEFSPKKGYLYAGLYSVVDAWEQTGRSGFKICRFRLAYTGFAGDRTTTKALELISPEREKLRKALTVLRIVRDTRVSRYIKALYNYQCQVCGVSVPTQSGGYAEGAHIRPLGRPHDGDDDEGNLICLCPNHHVMFDRGMFSIENDLSLIGVERGTLHIRQDHVLDKANLAYHRESHGYR